MYSGLEEAVIRNIGACKQLSATVATAYGPIGMNKMVINHLGKLFVTNDAATIIRELEVTNSLVYLKNFDSLSFMFKWFYFIVSLELIKMRRFGLKWETSNSYTQFSLLWKKLYET